VDDSDIVKDFLVESHENLDRLDRDLVGLEKNPNDKDALAGVFRTIHTIKGTCGFLAFNRLEKVAHVGENLLTRLRDGLLTLNPEITTALLGMVDAVRQMLKEIELTGQDGAVDYPELRETLTRLQQVGSTAAGEDVVGVSPRQEEIRLPAPKRAKAPAAKVKAQEAISSVPLEPVPLGCEEPAKHENSMVIQQGPDSRHRDPAADTIRVGVPVLDKLMTLVGELVLARNQLLQISNTVEGTSLQAVSQRMNLIATDLQEQVMKTRMQPIGNIWGQFPRTVRDVAIGCGKKVGIEMEGRETELDKTIIEAIKDPLTHLVRNSVDHGIELPEDRVKAGKNPVGRLILRAFHEGGQVNIEISDDGAGLNVERIRKKAVDRGVIIADQAARMTEGEIFNLIFLPGFSTADKVTNVSGRGVGMDVVKTNVERIGGTVDVQSALGRGTTVRVKIPLTLAIIPALVVTCGGDRYAIPQVSLRELVRLEADEVAKGIEFVHGAPVYRLRGRLLPLVYLNRELNLAADARPANEQDGAVNIVVLQADERQFGLVVDQINDTEEIVVKPLRKQLKTVKTFAGSSIMGDGKVALILDVLGLAQRAGVVTETRDRALSDKATETATTESEKQAFLLFAGMGDSRMAIPLSALARLEEFPVAQVEMSGKQWVTQYRGQILTLLRLVTVMEERRSRLRAFEVPPALDSGPLQVLVLNHEGKSFGLVVEQILDIVEDKADVRSAATRPSVLYSVVIGDRVTELLDIPAILRGTELKQTTRLGEPVTGSGGATIKAIANTSQFCTFYLDKMLFGVELEGVQEVIRTLDMTQVPLAPGVVRGLINLRGQIVTAVDLRRRLELEPGPPGLKSMNLVVRSEDGAVSLLVDEIGDVVEVEESSFEPPPETLRGLVRNMILGVHKLQDRLMLVLDIEKACEMTGVAKTMATTPG
jgi:two-component system chemotaxis sensor kinase CheA